MQDRKKRIHVNTDVLVNGQKRAESLDLSEDGMYVFTSYTFTKGLNVYLEFKLGANKYDVRANIVHSQEGIGFGVNFVDMDPPVAGSLRAYVDSH
jgi:hypothetical protein